jgi:hypothetical protein
VKDALAQLKTNSAEENREEPHSQNPIKKLAGI